MVVAAPLLVAGRPATVALGALPPSVRRRVGRWRRRVGWAGTRRAVARPALATVAFALALWGWHVPALFVAALERPGLHVLQHACFFASALAFWWAMFGGAARRAGVASLGCLFATMLHTSALGALITFAPSAWYVPADASRLFGLTPLEDQQLGGLIMWVPAGLAYVVAALALFAGWMRSSERERNRSIAFAVPSETKCVPSS